MPQIIPSCRPSRLIRGLVAALTASAAGAAIAADINLAFVGNTDGDGWRGASQGIEEANAQGKFLGRHYALSAVAGPAVEGDAVVIVADVPALRLARIVEANPGRAVINISAEDDNLRESCGANLLHTIPSEAMRRDAVQQWQRKAPGNDASALAWHQHFRKYAAAQLNKRYTARTGRPMNDVAWAGWAAVKALADVIAAQQVDAPDAVLEALRGEIAFDGQKGAGLSFRDTGQLRQPLLLVQQDRIVGEAPVRGVVDASNLDSLGLASCLK